MEKREVVEQWLHECCLEMGLMFRANDPYEPEQEEQDNVLNQCDGLVSYTKYEQGTDEWENFEPEGWLYSEPTDAQVEKLFPIADEYFGKLGAE